MRLSVWTRCVIASLSAGRVRRIGPAAVVLSVEQLAEDVEQMFEVDRVLHDGKRAESQRFAEYAINVALGNGPASNDDDRGIVGQSSEQVEQPKPAGRRWCGGGGRRYRPPSR